MDIERLCALTCKATEHTLRYHGADVFDEHVEILIRDEIQDLYPLRTTAQDTSVADLEITCDAAVSVADAYNKSVPESSRINLRWFYTCVQGLLLIDLLPAALLDGKVERLSRKVPFLFQENLRSASERNASPQASSSTLGPDAADSTPEKSPSSSNDTTPVPAKAAKAKWEHEEIQLMVELKASGLRHSDIATRLGRGQGSVENKYGRIMHKDEWKNYSSSYEATLQPKDTNAEDDECESPSS